MKTLSCAALALCVAPVARADAPPLYERVEAFEGWAVVCQLEEDMGATEIFDCGLQSAASPGIAILNLQPNRTPTLWIAQGVAGLELAGAGVALPGCDARQWCRTELDARPLLAALEAGQKVFIATGAGAVALHGGEVGAALALARALPD